MEVSGENTENEKQYFEKTIKLYDDVEPSDDNIIRITESSNMQIGTGSRVWESAIVLGKYALKQNLEKGIFKKKTILEIGSGTGLLAIMLASLGNKVFATDLPEVVKILQKNVDQNTKIFEGKGQVTCFPLDWNLETDRIKELFDKEGVSQIDYIFASDVIFNIKHLEIVPKAIKNIIQGLKTKNSLKEIPLIYISHKARDDLVDDNLAETFQKYGLYGEQIDEHDMDINYRSQRIDIFQLEFEDS